MGKLYCVNFSFKKREKHRLVKRLLSTLILSRFFLIKKLIIYHFLCQLSQIRFFFFFLHYPIFAIYSPACVKTTLLSMRFWLTRFFTKVLVALCVFSSSSYYSIIITYENYHYPRCCCWSCSCCFLWFCS